jgi:WD40 repeat protein
LFNEPIKARPTSRRELALRWCRRNPTAATWVALAFFFLIAGIAGVTYWGIRAYEGEKLAQAEAQEAEKNLELSERRAYGLEISRAFQEWKDGQVYMVLKRLGALEPGSGKPDLRGFEWYYLDRLCQLDLRSIQAHLGSVHGISISPDGGWIASAGEDRSVKVWETATGHEKYALSGHEGRVQSVAFSPDGRWLASGGWDDTIRLWDMTTGKEVRQLKGDLDRVNGLAFSPDGKRLAAASADYKVSVWDWAKGRKELEMSGHRGFVRSVDFSPDGLHLASAGYDGTIRLWDAVAGKPISVLEGHSGGVFSVTFSPDGRRLASGGNDQTLRMWDTQTGRNLFTLYAHVGVVTRVAFSSDGRRLASAGHDHVIRIWDAESGRENLTLRGHTGPVLTLAWSRDDRMLVSGDSTGKIKIWDALTVPDTAALNGHVAGVNEIAFSPDGQQLVSASADGTLRIWRITSGDELFVLKGHHGAVKRVLYSPDGRLVVSAGKDGTIRLWDAGTGTEQRTINAHRGPVYCLVFSQDGRQLASGGEDRTAHIWNVASGKEVIGVEEQPSPPAGVAFSPDGSNLRVTLQDQTTKVWNAASGEELATESGAVCLTCAAVSADGHRIAAGGCGQDAIIRDAQTGKELFTLTGQTGCIWRLAFDGEGRRLVSTVNDNYVRIWDTSTGRELISLEEGYASKNAPRRDYSCVAVSQDGRRVAAGRSDGTVTIWDGGPLTPDQRARREAQSVAAALFSRGVPAANAEKRIQQDATIGAEVRQQALALAAPYARMALQMQARDLVQDLFTRPLFQEEVLERLRGYTELNPTTRQQALALALEYPAQADILWLASWMVSRRPGAQPSEYERALRQAQAGCKDTPEDVGIRRVIGMLQYRLGRYEEAIRTLTECDRLCGKPPFERAPWDQAFIAMAQYCLGRQKEADAAFARMEEMMKEPRWISHPEAETFRREAERVLAEPGPVSNK